MLVWIYSQVSKGDIRMPPSLSTSTSVKAENISFSKLLKSRSFTALWLGQTFSQFGDAILWVALPLTVYSMGQSTLQMGFVMGLLMLPQVLLLPFTGILVDRVSRSKVMMITDSFRCTLVIGLSVLAKEHQLTVPLLYTFVLLFGSMDALFQPAYSATRAEVFTPDIRNRANGLTQVSQQAARLLGPAIGGAAIGLATVAAGFAIDALTLFVSVSSLAFLHLGAPERTSLKTSGALLGFLHELTGGFQELRKHQWLWITIIAFAFINIASSGISTILLPWLIKVHLGLSAALYGLVSSASGIGAIVCALVYGRRKQWHKRGLIAYAGVAGSGIAGLALVFVHSPFLLMVVTAASSACIMMFGLTWEGSLQELVAKDAFGRVASLDMFGSFALLPVGNILTGWLAMKVGGIATIALDAIFILLVTFAVLMVPSIRQFD